jgi:hypothetical protein
VSADGLPADHHPIVDPDYGAGFRSIWNGAKLWLTGISSIVLTFTCGGWLVAHSIAAAMSSAVSGCVPAYTAAARVVDQDVDLGKVRRKLGREALDAGAVPDVESQREQDAGAEFLGQIGEPLGPPRGSDDPVPEGREPAGGRGPETGARAGDEYSPHGTTLANRCRAG